MALQTTPASWERTNENKREQTTVERKSRAGHRRFNDGGAQERRDSKPDGNVSGAGYWAGAQNRVAALRLQLGCMNRGRRAGHIRYVQLARPRIGSCVNALVLGEA